MHIIIILFCTDHPGRTAPCSCSSFTKDAQFNKSLFTSYKLSLSWSLSVLVLGEFGLSVRSVYK